MTNMNNAIGHLNKGAAPSLTHKKPYFGQLVIGPPGSGKTTYCCKINEFYKKLDRNVCIINLDPANERINHPYEATIDIMDLITVTDVMNHLRLGPNGSLIYCMEYLEKNFDWLLNQLKDSQYTYFIFDCPGQVELYIHHNSIRNIFNRITTELGINLCGVQLIDSHYCSEPSKFIATIMLSLSTMLQIGLPHVNVLSKVDQLKTFHKKLLFNFDYYTQVLDLNYLLEAFDGGDGGESEIPNYNKKFNGMTRKYKKLNEAIVSMITDYSLVKFQPLDVNSTQSLLRLKQVIDKANGYCYGATEEKSINTLLTTAFTCETETERMAKDFDPYI